MSKAYVHPQAIVDATVSVGDGTRVWAFAHIIGRALVGKDCNICDHTFIESSVRIGDRVTVKCGVYLWDGLIIEDDVFIGPSAVFTNDRNPRSKLKPDSFPPTILMAGCSVGANAVVLPGITVGKSAMIGAGAVVTRNVPDHALVIGNPARQVGWVCKCGLKLNTINNQEFLCGCGLTYTLTGRRKLFQSSE